MKIVHVTKFFYPDIGGIQTVIWRLCHHQLASGHQVGVVTLDRLLEDETQYLPHNETIEGIVVKRVPYWGNRRYAVAPGVLRHIGEYDLIHLHSSDFFLDCLAWTQFVHKKPMVLSTHGLFFHTDFAHRLKQIYFHTATRLNLRHISAVICVSHHDLGLIRKISPNNKIHLIPNGIRYKQLSKLTIKNRDRDLYISIGRIAPNKRYDRLLETFALVVKKHTAAKLVIIGPDRGLVTSLKNLCRSLGIKKQVEFAGRVSDNELLNFLECASVWLAAPEYEGFGVALLEAMAAGCVPVVQPLPVFEQLLTHGTEGFYADFSKPAQACEVILKAANLSQCEREEITTRARSKASQFSWDSVAMQYQEVYEDVLQTYTP